MYMDNVLTQTERIPINELIADFGLHAFALEYDDLDLAELFDEDDEERFSPEEQDRLAEEARESATRDEWNDRSEE